MLTKGRENHRQDELYSAEDRFLQEDRSLHHDVYAVIIEWIHTGKMKPSDRVSEAAIARTLGISRGPVREAISRLDHEGLIVKRPRRGALVSSFTVKDLEDIVTARTLIEVQAARTACTLMTPENYDELNALIQSMAICAAEARWTDTALLNGRFHQTVVRISDNKILLQMWKTLPPLAWLLASSVNPNQPQNADLVRRHTLLLDALNSGDPDQAEQAFREHVINSSRKSVERTAEITQME